MTPEETKAQEEPARDVELRRSPRLQCSGDVGIQMLPVYERPSPGKIINLSLGGCLVALETPQELVMDEIVELIFSVNQMPFHVRGTVRAIRSGPLIGFQFSHLSNRVRMRLEDLIKELIEELAKMRDGSFARRPELRRRWF